MLRGRPARCVGARPVATATTGPTPASPARPSSGGMSVTEEWIDVEDISNRSKSLYQILVKVISIV